MTVWGALRVAALIALAPTTLAVSITRYRSPATMHRGNLIPPTDLPPTDLGGEDDDDFEADVPRPAFAWGVYVSRRGRDASGFYGEGYFIPDLFPTEGDAVSYIERNVRLEGAKAVRIATTAAKLAELSEGTGEAA